MDTKQEAEETLAKVPLKNPVTVTDTVRGAVDRRVYSYTNAHGNLVEIEIDAAPSVQQLKELTNNLPLDAKDRAAAAETIAGVKSP